MEKILKNKPINEQKPKVSPVRNVKKPVLTESEKEERQKTQREQIKKECFDCGSHNTINKNGLICLNCGSYYA